MRFTSKMDRPLNGDEPEVTRPKRDWLLWAWILGALAFVFLQPAPYLQASGAQKVNETVNSLNALQGQIVQLFADQGSYGDQSLTADMILAGIVPSDMVTSPDTLTNVWDGAVTIQPVANGQNFSISFADVPQDACIALLTKLAGGQSQTNLLGFHVQPNAPPGTAQQPSILPPVNVTGAIDACQGQQVNGITFFYQ